MHDGGSYYCTVHTYQHWKLNSLPTNLTTWVGSVMFRIEVKLGHRQYSYHPHWMPAIIATSHYSLTLAARQITDDRWQRQKQQVQTNNYRQVLPYPGTQQNSFLLFKLLLQRRNTTSETDFSTRLRYILKSSSISHTLRNSLPQPRIIVCF